MYVLKQHGNVFGAKLTKAEEKALDIEIRRSMAEYDKKNTKEIDATILWILSQEYGFDTDELKKFYNQFMEHMLRLINAYQMEESDMKWLCTEMLRRRGIDLDEWEQEYEKNGKVT